MSSFCKCKSYSHFFSKNTSINAIFNDQSFNDTLTNDIFSFEQLGPEVGNVNHKAIWTLHGENDPRNDFLINLYKSYVAELRFELANPGSASRDATDCTMEPREILAKLLYLILVWKL